MSRRPSNLLGQRFAVKPNLKDFQLNTDLVIANNQSIPRVTLRVDQVGALNIRCSKP